MRSICVHHNHIELLCSIPRLLFSSPLPPAKFMSMCTDADEYDEQYEEDQRCYHTGYDDLPLVSYTPGQINILTPGPNVPFFTSARRSVLFLHKAARPMDTVIPELLWTFGEMAAPFGLSCSFY